MKRKYLALFFLFLLIVFVRTDWNRVWHADYRHMVSYSESQKTIFEQRLASLMKVQSTIHVRDLVDFDWDAVCVARGYTRLREDMAQANAYGKDMPELELYPQISEGRNALLFIKQDKPLAIIEFSEPEIRYAFKTCGAKKTASLGLISADAKPMLSKGTRENRYIVQPLNIERYENCLGTNCELTFHGD